MVPRAAKVGYIIAVIVKTKFIAAAKAYLPASSSGLCRILFLTCLYVAAAAKTNMHRKASSRGAASSDVDAVSI